MGCDAFANKDGVFSILVCDYENLGSIKFQPRVIRIEGLNPRHKIIVEILEGEER